MFSNEDEQSPNQPHNTTLCEHSSWLVYLASVFVWRNQTDRRLRPLEQCLRPVVMASFVVNENIGGTPKRPSLLIIPVDARDRRDDLVMMQLPSSLKAIDLVGSRIIVNDKKSNEKKNDTSLPLLSQACLVSDDRAFLMSRVETSNAWILVEGKTTVKDDKRPTKRLKSNASTVSLRDNKFGQVIPVELLGNGSGASFWELTQAGCFGIVTGSTSSMEPI